MSEQDNTPRISLSDMALMVSIIDICSSRGAFKGEEMLEVGQLRSKLVAFVDHAQKQPSEQTENDDGQDSNSIEAAS